MIEFEKNSNILLWFVIHNIYFYLRILVPVIFLFLLLTVGVPQLLYILRHFEIWLLSTRNLSWNHILLVAFPDEVLLNDSQKLTNVRVALNHIFEALQSIYLYQLLLEQFKLLNLLPSQGQVLLCLFDVYFTFAFLRICCVLLLGLLRGFDTLSLLLGLIMLLQDQIVVVLQLLL